MLKELLQKLATDLSQDLDSFVQEEKGVIHLKMGANPDVVLRELKPGLVFTSTIGAIPKERKEELFSFLMHANVLGQGTGGAAIGMDEYEKFLTLCLNLNYDINYTEFKARVEEFSNFTVYWQEELKRFKKETEESVVS